MSSEIIIAHAWDKTPLPPAERVSIGLSLSPAERSVQQQLIITIDAPFFGDSPPPAMGSDPRRYDGLWNFEVIELFIGSLAPSSDPRTLPYLELEFGPHGHALGLVFAAYRQRLRSITVTGSAEQAHGRWRAEATIPGEHLPPSPWALNAFGIHGPPTSRRHQVAFLPPGTTEPDFHDRSSWRACALAPPT